MLIGKLRRASVVRQVYCAYALVSQPARVQVLVLIMAGLLVLLCVHANVNVNNLVAISMFNFDISGQPGQKAKRVVHLETPLRQLHVTHRASSCAKRGGRVEFCSKPKGVRGIKTRDLPKKGSAFILSSDHWTCVPWFVSFGAIPGLCFQACVAFSGYHKWSMVGVETMIN